MSGNVDLRPDVTVTSSDNGSSTSTGVTAIVIGDHGILQPKSALSKSLLLILHLVNSGEIEASASGIGIEVLKAAVVKDKLREMVNSDRTGILLCRTKIGSVFLRAIPIHGLTAEVQVLEGDLFYAYKALKDKGIKPYDIVRCEEKVDPIIDFLVKKDEEGYDYAFLDLPGNVDNEEYNQILSLCNVVFLPFIGDDLNFDSNFQFAANSCKKVLQSASNENLKKIYGYWNRYNKNVRKSEFQSYCKKISEELPIVEMLDNKFEFTNAAGNKYFMNTLVTPIKNYAGYGNISGVIEEMYNKIEKLD
jgi:hypothetical protein